MVLEGYICIVFISESAIIQSYVRKYCQPVQSENRPSMKLKRLVSRLAGFIGICLVVIVIYFPVFFQGRILFNANHLVAFFQPWASMREWGWGLSVQHKPIGEDDLRIFYPQRLFTSLAMLKYKEIPFWNPLTFAGNHHAGLSETAVFYPLNILFLILPQVSAWTLLALIEPIVVALGMYLFLRLLIKDSVGSWAGAITYAFCSVVMARMVEGLSVGHTLLWLPWVFWCVEAYSQTDRFRYVLYLLLSLIFSFTAGWFQFTFYVLAFGFIFALYRISIKRQWAILMPFIVFPLFSLYHLIPVMSAYFESPRGIETNHVVGLIHLVPIQHLLTLIFPDLWGNPGTFNYFGAQSYKEPLVSIGVIPLLLAITALSAWRKDPIIRFFGITVLLTCVIAVDSFLSRFLVALPIPIVSSFIPSRIFVLTSFSLSVLTAFGVGWLYTKNTRPVVVRSAIILGVIALVSAGLVWGVYIRYLKTTIETPFFRALVLGTGERLRTEARNTVFPLTLLMIATVLLTVSRKVRAKYVLVALLTILTFVQIWYSARKYIAFSDSQYVYPSHPVLTALSKISGTYRFVSLGDAHMTSNTPLAFGLSSTEGVGSMYIQRYGELMAYVTDPQHRADRVLRIESYINPAADELLMDQHAIVQRFLEISGTKYIVTVDNDADHSIKEQSARAHYKKVWQEGHWQIWEDKMTQPRTFVTGDFSVETNNQAILSDIFSSAYRPRHITLESSPGFAANIAATGSAEIISFTANTITIHANADKRALVYLSDTFSRTFRARVDGKSAPLLRANYAFRAVAIPAGIHTVQMYYDTTLWNIGTGISIALWVFGGVSTYLLVRLKRIIW